MCLGVHGSNEEIAMRVPNSSHAGNIYVIHEVHQCLKQADADYYYKVMSLLNLELPASASQQA